MRGRSLGRVRFRSGGPGVRILVIAFDCYAIFLVRPCAKINHLAALGAERAEWRFRSPMHRYTATRATDCALILGHRLHRVSSNSTFEVLVCGRTSSPNIAKRMLSAYLLALIS